MKTNFWDEAPGIRSANRLIFIIGSIWNFAIITFLAIKLLPEAKISVGDLIALFSAIQGILVGLKLGQKAMEPKTDLLAKAEPKE